MGHAGYRKDAHEISRLAIVAVIHLVPPSQRVVERKDRVARPLGNDHLAAMRAERLDIGRAGRDHVPGRFREVLVGGEDLGRILIEIEVQEEVQIGLRRIGKVQRWRCKDGRG